MSEQTKRQTVVVEIDEVLTVLVADGDQRIAKHILHAVEPNGSLAYFRGGPTGGPVEDGLGSGRRHSGD